MKTNIEIRKQLQLARLQLQANVITFETFKSLVIRLHVEFEENKR